MHLSRNCPFSDKTNLHLELPGCCQRGWCRGCDLRFESQLACDFGGLGAVILLRFEDGLKSHKPRNAKGNLNLECRKWGFKRWVLKEIREYPRKKALFLRFLEFPGALRTLRKRAKRQKKGGKGCFPGRVARRPLNPHLLHPHLRQLNE